MTDATNITYDDTTVEMPPTTATTYIPTTTSEIQTTITTHNGPITTMTTQQATTTTTEQTTASTKQAIVTSTAKSSVTSAITPNRTLSNNEGQCCSCCFLSSELSNISESYTNSLYGCVHCNIPEDKVVTTQTTTTGTTIGSIDPEPVYPDQDHLKEYLADLSEKDKARLGYRLPELIVRSYFSGYTVPLRWDMSSNYTHTHTHTHTPHTHTHTHRQKKICMDTDC